MLAAARPKIKEKDITGLKFFKQLGPLLERLHDNGCQRDLLSVLQAYAGLSSSAQPQPKRHRNPDVLGDHRLPQIAGWALVSATVGMILKAIESRSERVGEIVAGLLGMAWSITTFFVVPILVVEKLGPIDAFKRSVSVMRDTWGESLAANFGIGLFTTLAALLGLLPIAAGIAMVNASPVGGGVLIGIGVLWMMFVSLVSSALSSIALAALYIYASEGQSPKHFDSRMIRGAFATKAGA